MATLEPPSRFQSRTKGCGSLDRPPTSEDPFTRRRSMEDDGVSSDEERWMLGMGMDVTTLLPESDYVEADDGEGDVSLPVVTSRRERLQPWMQWLHYSIKLDAYPSRAKVLKALEDGIVWVGWSCESDASRGYEAMELLALLSILDYSEWSEVVQEIWPEGAALWFHHFQGRRFRLGCQVDTLRRGVITKACERFVMGDLWFVTAAMETRSSQDYLAIRQELEDAARQSCSVSHQSLEIPVSIKFSDNMHVVDGAFSDLWLEVTQSAAMQVMRDRGRSDNVSQNCRWSPLFHIFKVDTTEYNQTWRRKDLLYARQIAACGIQVIPLRLCTWEMNAKLAPVILPTLHQLFTIGEVVDGLTGAKSVLIDDALSAQALDSVFSAVFSSQSVRELTIQHSYGLDEQSRQRLWKWLALAVFSDDAPIKTIAVHGSSIADVDINELHKSMNIRHGVDTLFARRGTKLFSAERVVATASKFRLTSPSRQSSGDDVASVVILRTPLANLRVLNTGTRDSKWISVLLPGWGQAWIARADASVSLLRSLTGGTERDNTQPSLHLVIDYPDSEHEAVYVNFLSTVGHTVRKLTFKHCHRRYHMSASAIRAILRACPHLEELEVGAISPEVLESIIASYSDGDCRVKNLVMESYRMDLSDALHRFVNILGDRQHPMAQHLVHFALHANNYLPGIEAVAESIIRMLQSSSTLEEFDFRTVNDPPFTVGEGVAPEDEFDALNGRPCFKPFPLPAKIAFLSVMWIRDPEKEASKRQRREPSRQIVPSLDVGVISNIFHFAGLYKTRLVRVRFARLA